MLITRISIVALLCGSVVCFHYDKDCIAKDGWYKNGIRSSWDIKFWVSKGDTGSVLLLLSENPPKSSLRKIDITRKQVDYFFGRDSVREQNSTSIAGNGMSPGWNEVRVTSDERFMVWVTGMDDPLVDVEDEVQTDRLLIMGSNVTVNCEGPMTVWVATEDKEIFVPLEIPGPHDITLFSRTPFSPVMKFGHQIQLLSWDSKASTITTFAVRPEPLPPFIEHNFTVQCDSDDIYFKCTAVAGQNNTLVASVHLLEQIESFSFHGPGATEFVIVLRYTNEGKMPEDVEIHNKLEERVTPGYNSTLQEKNSSLYITLFMFIPINILLVEITIVLCIKNKKLKEIIRSDPSLADRKESNVATNLYAIFCGRWKGEQTVQETDKNNEDKLLNGNVIGENVVDSLADRDGDQPHNHLLCKISI